MAHSRPRRTQAPWATPNASADAPIWPTAPIPLSASASITILRKMTSSIALDVMATHTPSAFSGEISVTCSRTNGTDHSVYEM